MQNIAGTPVEGDDFFGREGAIRSFWDLLGNHDILLLGPRRIGKTSLSRRLMVEARQHGWSTIEANVASCTDERAFVEKLAQAIKSEAGSWVGAALEALGGLLNRVDRVRLPGDAGFDLSAKPEAWEAIASDALALLTRQSNETLIYIDELPIFLFNLLRFDVKTGKERVRRFLDWFRNDARDATRGKGLHWLMSGSVGLDTLVQTHGMADAINTLRQRALDPFSDEEALAFLERLAESYKLPVSLDDRKRLVAAIGWPQPYYLQLAFQNIRAMWREGQPVGSLIDDAINRLIEPGEDNDFHHWEERLRIQHEQSVADLAIALLTIACRKPDGASTTALFAEAQRLLPDLGEEQQKQRFIALRDVLIRDGYWAISETDGARRCHFRLEPLRRWWSRRNTL